MCESLDCNLTKLAKSVLLALLGQFGSFLFLFWAIQRALAFNFAALVIMNTTIDDVHTFCAMVTIKLHVSVKSWKCPAITVIYKDVWPIFFLTCETIHKCYSEHSMFFNAIFTKTGPYSAYITVDNISWKLLTSWTTCSNANCYVMCIAWHIYMKKR